MRSFKGKLLIVEDDVVSGRALQAIFTRRGWSVVWAQSLAAGVSALDTQSPDVLILDLMLPDGEGTVLLERIRREKRSTRVMVTTAVSDPDRLARVHDLRPDSMLHKPVSLAELLRNL